MARQPVGYLVKAQTIYDNETKIRKLADGTFRGTVNPVPVFTDNGMVAGWLMIHTMVLPNDNTVHITLLPMRGLGSPGKPLTVDVDLTTMKGGDVAHWHDVSVLWDANRVADPHIKGKPLLVEPDGVRKVRVALTQEARWTE